MTEHEVPEGIKESLEIDLEGGCLRVRGERFCLVTPTMLIALHKELETLMGKSAKAPIYMAGEKAARAKAGFYRQMLHEAGMTEPGETEKLEYLSRAMAGFGHGRFEIASMDPSNSTMNIRVKNSLIAEAYGTSETPVCHFYAGYHAGIAKTFTGMDVHCEEIRCSAMGGDVCEFHIAPLEAFAAILPQVMSARHRG